MFAYTHYLTTSNAGTTQSATQQYVASSEAGPPASSTFSTNTWKTTHTWAYDGSSYTEVSYASEALGGNFFARSYVTEQPAGARTETQVTKTVRWSSTYTEVTATQSVVPYDLTASASSSSSSTEAVGPAQFQATTRDTTYAITGETTGSSTHSQTFALIVQSGFSSTFSGTASRVRTSSTYTSTQSGTTTWPIFAAGEMSSLWSHRLMVTRSLNATAYVFSTQYKPVALAFVPTATVTGVQTMPSFSAGSYSLSSLCNLLTSLFYGTVEKSSNTSQYSTSSLTVTTNFVTAQTGSSIFVTEFSTYASSTRTVTQHVITGTLFSNSATSAAFSAQGKALVNSLLSEGGNFNSQYVTVGIGGTSGPVYGSFIFTPAISWTGGGFAPFFAQINLDVINAGGAVYTPLIYTRRLTSENVRVLSSYGTLCWSYLYSSWRLFATMSEASTSLFSTTYTEQGDPTTYDENDNPVYETLTVTESQTLSSRMPSGSTATTEIQTSGTSLASPTAVVGRTASPIYTIPGQNSGEPVALGPLIPWSTHGLNEMTTFLTSAGAWFSHRLGSAYSTSSSAYSSGASTQSGSFTIGTGDGVLEYPNSSLTIFSALPAAHVTSTATASGPLHSFGSWRFFASPVYGGNGVAGNAKHNELSRGDFPSVNSRTYFYPVTAQ